METVGQFSKVEKWLDEPTPTSDGETALDTPYRLSSVKPRKDYVST